MVEEIPLAVELRDAGVVRAGVLVAVAEDALRLEMAVDAVGHGVGDALGHEPGGVGEVVFAVVLVDPGAFGEAVLLPVDVEALHRAVELDHVFLELGVVAVAVAPDEVRLAVVVDHDGRVDARPGVAGGEAVFRLHELLADGVLVGAFRLIGDRDADARAVGAGVEVVFAVARDHLRGVGGVRGVPLEIGNGDGGGPFRPGLHVLRGEEAPVLHGVVRVRTAVLGGVVVAGDEPERVADHDGRGVGGVFVLEDGVVDRLVFADGLHVARGGRGRLRGCGLGLGSGRRHLGLTVAAPFLTAVLALLRAFPAGSLKPVNDLPADSSGFLTALTPLFLALLTGRALLLLVLGREFDRRCGQRERGEDEEGVFKGEHDSSLLSYCWTESDIWVFKSWMVSNKTAAASR